MPTANVPNFVPALPEIFLACAAMALLMLGVFQRALAIGERTKTAAVISWLAILALGLTMLLASSVTAGRTPTFGGLFVNDPFALFFKMLALAASAASLLIARGYLERHRVAQFEFAVLVLFATVGMMMMLSANDLISLYVGLELQSLCLYVVASFQRDDTRSTEAGLKYFVLSALASGFLLYGSSLIYGFTSTTNFELIARSLAGGTPSLGIIFGLVFVLAGLAFKVSAAPFHMWTPDVYEGAPTPVTAFFSIAPKIAAIGLLIRVVVGPFGDLVQQWQQVIWIASILSMFVGAFAAIWQNNIKRLMAYSSIGHVGYALIGLAAGTRDGAESVLIYMAIYITMNLGAFAGILCMRRNDRMVEGIDDLAGLSKSHPILAIAISLFMFSMAGIPPLAGFFGKLYVFKAAITAGQYGLALVGVMTSVVAAFYYLRIVKIIYFDELGESLDKPVAKDLGFVLFATAAVILLFFAWPDPLLLYARAAVASLFGG